MKRAVRCFAAALSAICLIIAEQRISLPEFADKKISFYNFSTIHLNNQSKIISHSTELLDIIPTKAADVRSNEKKFVIPCGTLFGIKFYTKGAVIIECCDIGRVNPGQSCGLRPGDTIIEMDGCKIDNCADAERLIAQSGGETISLLCLRDGKEFLTNITPQNVEGTLRLGLWIKDSAAGLGTLTFYDPESRRFASLGHGICDDETGELLEIEKAEITRVEVAGISRASSGQPGIINGYFDDAPSLGTADINNECGLFGELNGIPYSGDAVEIADCNEVKKGKASILCSIDGNSPKMYDIEITNISSDENNKTKNLQIIVTDERLLTQTGGIVRGMSGSPILQNGKLVGAVTHVLLTNSAKGYGIFAQNMFEEMD